MTRVMTMATIACFSACTAVAQPAPPAFEVASVKPNSSGGPKLGKGLFAPGRVSFPNATLKQFIMAAFDVRSNMISGGPEWLDSGRFDILAKAPPETDEETLRIMLQTLLSERFKLVTHRKETMLPEYALTVAKSGAKLEQSSLTGKSTCTWEKGDHDLRRRVCHNMTMAELAIALPRWGGAGIDRPVIDLTGLKGSYDFNLEVPSTRKAGEKDDSGPTVLDALAKLGLKLEARKAPLSTIVIDHAEKPSEN